MRRQVLLTDDHQDRPVRIGMPGTFSSGLIAEVFPKTITIRSKFGATPRSHQAGEQALWLQIEMSNHGLRTLDCGQEVWVECGINRHLLGSFVGFCQHALHVRVEGISCRLSRQKITTLWVGAVITGVPEPRPALAARLRQLPRNCEIRVLLDQALDRCGIAIQQETLPGRLIGVSDFEGILKIEVDELGELHIPYTHVLRVFVHPHSAATLGEIVGAEGYVPHGKRGYRGAIRRGTGLNNRKFVIASVPPHTVLPSELWVAVPSD